MDQSFSLEGKVIIVTGGTGALGKSFIDGIAEAGGTVGILGRNRNVAEDRATKINLEGGKAIALCADVTNKNDLNNAKKLVMDTYGKIDGLVNAAGCKFPEGTIENNHDIFNLSLEGLKMVMELNLWGTILPTQIFGDAIANQGEGSIINISPIGSKHVINKILGYSMAKASVECFTKWFAMELRKKYGYAIKINSIVPGFSFAEQNMTVLAASHENHSEHGNGILQRIPFQRFGEPDELQGIVVWLLSNASKFITGATISVDEEFKIESIV